MSGPGMTRLQQKRAAARQQAGLLADAKWWAKPLPDLEIVT